MPGTHFAPSYFAPTYFPAAYMPPAAAADLLAAIWLQLRTVPAVAAALPGGLWIERAGRGTAYPLAIMDEVTGTTEADSGPNQVETREVQFRVFAPGKEPARKAAAAIRNALDPADGYRKLRFRGGVELRRYPRADGMALDDAKGPGGIDVWNRYFTFSFLVESAKAAGSY